MAYPGIVLLVLAGVAVGSMLYYLYSSPTRQQHQIRNVHALPAPPPRPSSRSVSSTTRRRRKSPTGRENIEVCSICCENLFNDSSKPVVIPCDHYFHSDCIKQWIARKYSCPNCMASIPRGLIFNTQTIRKL